MMRGDEKRFEKGALLVDKDELMALAQLKEGFLLEFEAEMCAAVQTRDLLMMATRLYLHLQGHPNLLETDLEHHHEI